MRKYYFTCVWEKNTPFNDKYCSTIKALKGKEFIIANEFNTGMYNIQLFDGGIYKQIYFIGDERFDYLNEWNKNCYNNTNWRVFPSTKEEINLFKAVILMDR